MTEPPGTLAGGVASPAEERVESDVNLLAGLGGTGEVALPRAASLSRDAWYDLRRNWLFVAAGSLILLLGLIAIVPQAFAGWFGHGNPHFCNIVDSMKPPSSGHPFGFDVQGCDLYSNVIYGARPSISIGLLVTAFATLIGVVVGLFAGYFAGLADVLVGRVTDIMYGFPFLLGAIVLLTALNQHTVWSVALALGLFGWPTATRVMRSSVLEVKQSEYVTAARALGASHARVALKYVLPNAIGPVIVLATLGVGGIISGEATLTFLGIGLRPPAISWGVQLNTAQSYFYLAPHLLVFPAVFLGVTVLSFLVAGDAVRDAFDPKLR